MLDHAGTNPLDHALCRGDGVESGPVAHLLHHDVDVERAVTVASEVPAAVVLTPQILILGD